MGRNIRLKTVYESYIFLPECSANEDFDVLNRGPFFKGLFTARFLNTLCERLCRTCERLCSAFNMEPKKT